jgi:hypothetical protein
MLDQTQLELETEPALADFQTTPSSSNPELASEEDGKGGSPLAGLTNAKVASLTPSAAALERTLEKDDPLPVDGEAPTETCPGLVENDPT